MNKFVMTAALAATLGMTAGVVHASPEGGHEMMKKRMMEKVDTDDNGAISKAEFMAKHEEKFGMMDADGNGELSSEELNAAHEKMKEKRKEWIQKRKEMKDQEETAPTTSEDPATE